MEDIKTLINQRQDNTTSKITKTPEPLPNKCEFCGKDIKPTWDWDHWIQLKLHEVCEHQIKRMERAGIHKRYWKLPPELIEEMKGFIEGKQTIIGNKRAFDEVNTFIKNPVKGIFLYGIAGTGKTYLSVKIFQALSQAQFISFPKFLLHLKNNFDDRTSWKNEDLIDKLGEAPILIIDDVGAEKMSEWVAEIFYILIDERYSRMLPTIITSNFSTQEIAERFGARISSRIIEMCKIIEIRTKDKREFMRTK